MEHSEGPNDLSLSEAECRDISVTNFIVLFQVLRIQVDATSTVRTLIITHKKHQ